MEYSIFNQMKQPRESKSITNYNLYTFRYRFENGPEGA